MDFQKLMIIFLIIFITLSVVLSSYLNKMIDTLDLQATYKKYLVDSTYDAVNAYQMNTMSATIATGEGNKRYVEASINTFFNSLATNMGVSGSDKIELQSYVPAILFTNYDGYYIYSPTKMPEIATDENGLGKTDGLDIKYVKEGYNGEIGKTDDDDETTKSDEGEVSYNYMVKPYVYYSATYSGNNYNIIINYSLDNYISIYGEREGQSITKSGYLIDYKNVELNGNIYIETYDGTSYRDQNVANNKLEQGMRLSGGTDFVDYDVNGDKIYNLITNYEIKDSDKTINGNRLQTGDEIIEDSLILYPDKITVSYKGINMTDSKEKEYYLKSYFFSRWVDENLGDIVNSNDIVEILDKSASGITDTIRGTLKSNQNILKIYNGDNLINNPDSDTSIFSDHKKLVIQNSIVYSLNSAISTYSQHYGDYDSELPVLSVSDWDSILNNISMTVFLQGIPCGNKRFSDYTTITSTNNNQFIDENNLYFAESIGPPDTTNYYYDYHKIDCPDLGKTGNTDYQADISAEFKYDARQIQVRCFSKYNGWWYNSDTGNLEYETEPGIITSKSLQDCRDGVYFYDERNNTYYRSNWEKISDFSEWGSMQNFVNELKNQGTNKYNEILQRANAEPMVVYLYEHKNTGCYECIVSSNYIPIIKFNDDGELELSDKVITSDGKLTEYGTNIFNTIQTANSELNKRKSAWYRYLARARNNLYKTNEYINR